MLRYAFSYTDISFRHLVIFKQDDYILAAGRDSTGRSRLYLINRGSNQVYIRHSDNWHPVGDLCRDCIVQKLAAAFSKGITCFTLNSSLDITQGINC